MAELVYTRRYSPALVAERVVSVVLGLIELLLALRLVLELLAANPGAAFIAWIYQASENFVAPFQGAFPSLSLGGGSVIDLSTILAMIAYALVAWLLVRLMYVVFDSF